MIESSIGAKVHTVIECDKVVHVKAPGQHGQILILHNGVSVLAQLALVERLKEQEEVSTDEQLQDLVAEELEPLIIGRARLRLGLVSTLGHDAEEHVNAPLAQHHALLSLLRVKIAVVPRSHLTVEQTVPNVVRIGAQILMK